MTKPFGNDFTTLVELLEPGQILTHPVELLTYEIDAANDRGRPDGVVFPKTAEEVGDIVRWAGERKIPLIARGAGTGLSGGAVAERGGIILEFSRLNRILDLDTLGRSVVVEPGVINLKLDEHVRKAGLYFPPDPASGRSSTIGGNIAENAGGPHCFKYGVTTNYLTGLKAVLADGRTVQFGGRAVDYPEYDFTGLLTGSEGTLGIITTASFHLLRQPPAVKTLMAAFDSVEAAGEAVSVVIAHGLVPATMEMMDQKMMRIIEDYAHAGLPVNAGAALIIEVDGYPEGLPRQMEEVVAILRDNKAWDVRVAQSTEERDQIWYGRKSAAGAMARLSPAYLLLDGTVPRSKLASALAAINQVCEAFKLRVGYVFHAGDGNLHPFILIEDPSNQALLHNVHEAGQRVMEICVRLGGSITGEHGVGIEKRIYMPLMFNADELQAMLDVKVVFDAENLFNPGKIFPQKAAREEKLDTGKLGGGDLSSGCPGSIQDAAEMIRQAVAAGYSIRITEKMLGQEESVRSQPPEGTGYSNQVLSLSTQGLRGVSEYALEDLYITVGAGTLLAELQKTLSRDRMWVPLISPWPEATVGSLAASNFNAPLRMRYGSLRDLVLAATVVLPDGRVIRAGRPVVKNVAGYDLPKLFLGSYGSLGLIADLTLKIAPLPRTRTSLIVPVENMVRGLEWGMQLLPLCLVASALLLVHSQEPAASEPFALIYTAEGLAEDVTAEIAQVRQALQKRGATGITQIDAPSGNEAWASWVREGDQLVRAGVAPKDLPDLLVKLAPSLESRAFYADLASGLLYLQDTLELGILREAALQLGGYAVVMVSPKAIEGDIDPWGYSPESLEVMRRLKARWDPKGSFNPGSFLV